MALALMSSVSHAQQAYPSPEDAAAALAAAVKSGTKREILKVLGRGAEDIIESGDDVEDAETRKAFISNYDTKHSIKAEGNKKATLILGADDFPFPIPLVNNRTGSSTRPRGVSKFCIAASDAMNWMLFRPRWLTSMPRTNMPKRIEPARGSGFTHSASSVARARRTGCSGATIASRARWANWRRKHRPKATRSESRRRPIMATIFEF